MGQAAPRPCTWPGCGQLHCERHRNAARHEHDQRRGSAAKRLYGYAWQKASRAFLAAHPLCQCERCDEGRLRVRAASVVDHRKPHRGDAGLFWDSDNWQAMAKDCHDRKTAAEDGGFGNEKREG
jgi:5-methylcytosine-specific restriction protein A